MSITNIKGILHVKNEYTDIISLQVFSSAGVLVMSQQIHLHNGHEQVSLSMLPSGMYIATIRDKENNKCSIKFVKP